MIALGLSLLLHILLIGMAQWIVKLVPRPEPPPQWDNEKSVEVELGAKDQFVILPRKRQTGGTRACSAGDYPEWYEFEFGTGSAKRTMIDLINESGYGIMGDADAIRGKISRPLHGWYRPFDAIRLLAGDAGMCAIDMGDTFIVHVCEGAERPLQRANEAQMRQSTRPIDCSQIGQPKPRAPIDPSTI